MPRKVIFCVPTVTKPYQATLDSLAASIPLITGAGWDEGMVSEIGCPYISSARATMLRKALDANADAIVFIDHDVSWEPQDLLTLIDHPGDVVAGTYRFKRDEVEYMGAVATAPDGSPLVRDDGTLVAHSVPAGFLKVTKSCINRFMRAYPELIYGDAFRPFVDLFNHGAWEGVWYGEDYAFCRRWRACGGDIVLIPDLNITHHSSAQAYPGNFHTFLRQQPGGDLHKE